MLLWHVKESNSSLWISGDYSDWRFMDLDLEYAGGKYIWQDNGTSFVNTGTEDALTGRDKLEVRKINSSGGEAYGPFNGVDKGDASTFYTPNDGKNYTFYSNPNSNWYNTASGQNYSQNIVNGFSIKNLRTESGAVRADFSLNDFTITTNTTLSKGDWFFENSITVSSGVSLTIQPGSNINFKNGASLLVNGALNATGTSSSPINFNFLSPNSTTENGIQINSGATASITHCNITNAYCGVRCSGAFTAFSNNTVSGNTVGISLENYSSYNQIENCSIINNTNYGIMIVNTTGIIQDNEIRNHGYAGVYCYNYATTIMSNNRITGSPNYGVYLMSYSQGEAVTGISTPNLVTGNRIGLVANSNSEANLENNCMYDNNNTATGWEIQTLQSSSVTAENNWWGSNPPVSSRFYGANIDYSNYRTQSLCSGMSKSLATGDKNSSSNKGGNEEIGSGKKDIELDSAYHLRAAGKYEEAIGIYDKIIKKELTTQRAVFSLIGLSKCYELSKKEGFINYLNNELKGKLSLTDTINAVSVDLENHWLIKEKRYSEVLGKNANLITQFTDNPRIVKNAVFNAGYVYLTYLKDTAKAKEYFDLLTAKYPDDELANLSKFVMGTLTAGAIKKNESGNAAQKKEDKKLIPSEYSLEQNHPNPFNPATVITYQIPKAGKVLLKIFDILGKEIKTLVDNYKEAGSYQVTFNAGKLPSGVYIYRLESGSFVQSKKMILTK